MRRSHPTQLAAKWPGVAEGRNIDMPSSLVGPLWRTRLKWWLRGVREYVVFYCLLAGFGLTSLMWSGLAAALYRLLPRGLGEPLGQFVMTAGFRAFVGVMRVSGVLQCDLGELDLLARSAPLVIAPNHPSLLDAVLVISRLPHVAGAAKAPIWDNAFLGGGARLAGLIRNDSPTKLIREAVRHLRFGRHFLIFPEGTRSHCRPIGNFKGGFALIAKRAGVPVQTVFIETNSRFLGKGWPLFKKPAFPVIYRVRLGEQIAIDGNLHETVDRLSHYYRRELGPGDHTHLGA